MLFHGGHFGSHDSAGNANDWDVNFNGLSRWFRVFAADRMGQGFTDNSKSDDAYATASMMEYVYGFLQVLGLKNVSSTSQRSSRPRLDRSPHGPRPQQGSATRTVL